MKRVLVLSLMCFSGLVFVNTHSANGQAAGGEYVLMSDYLYTADDLLVGTITVHQDGGTASNSSGKDAEFVLRGENAGKFKIKKGNRLYIRKKYAKSAEKWVDVGVVTADGKLSADFRAVKDEFRDNSVVAHRGAWKHTDAPQNSIASFREAVKLECEGSEFDVHLTSDSVTVLFHDRHKDGLAIEETTFAKLAEERLSNGEVIPDLVSFLEAGMNQNVTRMVLEIKPSAVSKERGIALTEMIVRQVREAKAQGWVDYISFGYDICQRVMELNPYAKVAYLNGEKAPAEVAADGLFGLDYNQKVFKAKPDWVAESKKEGLTLNAWTVNDPEAMDWFLGHDFDFITTDEPELLLKKISGSK